MKFCLTTAFAVLLLAVGVWPASAQNSFTIGDGFRGASWGQSRLEIEEMVTHPPFHRDEHLVIFHDDFEGTPAEVIYFFLDDRLVMGFTLLLDTHDDMDAYFASYEEVKGQLGRTLGTPDVENWDLPLPELNDDRSLWGDALGFGLIKAEAGWLLGDTGVGLRLSGGEFQGHLMMVHFSRADMNQGRLAFKKYFGEKVGIPNEYFRN
jgi:hypothetical protein